MNYYYTQKTGGTEAWRPIREDKLDTLDSPMFITVLSVDTPISDDATKEQLAETKYKGPLYFDLDDANSPASTAMYAQKLVEKLSEQGVFPAQLEIFATGGKGFHVLVPEECFLTKPPKTGLPLLPAIFKEMAFGLAVDSMDFRVYTARKGRMFRRANVLRPNGLYKVRISAEELEAMAELAKEDPEAAEANYKELCSAPRKDLEVAQDTPELATGLLAMFDAAKAKITKAAAKIKKQRPVKFPAELPSFDAMLRGEGIKSDTGFHPIAMQVAITAHARGMTLQDLLAKSEGLCENHESDGYRYNTPAKRRAELSRMYDYTDDNPCYTYNPHAIRDLLTHGAPDLHGLEVTAEEVLEGMQAGSDSDEDSNSEFDHANVIMTRQGIFTMTEAGPKQLTAAAFTGVIELRSGEDGGIVALEADMTIGAKAYNGMTLTLEDFSSVNSFNKMLMRFGQTFSGTDIQSRGAYMRIVEKARKEGKSMYVIAKEGLSVVKIPFHEDDQAKQGFLVWADNKQVIVEPSMADKGMALKFVGFPEKAGQFQTDLSSAPNLVRWLAEDQNKDQLRSFLNNLLYCQSPAYLGKLLGWTMACHYRAMFHEAYGKFPMLHINGAAGAGKTEMTKLFANLHYYTVEPKMLTPTSTLFAVTQAVAGSASVPLVLDEFKPAEMLPAVYDKFKLVLRDAYNSRVVERGGGTRESADYRSVHRTQLSAPICFIAEAAESESALMERVVLLTLVKPPVIRAQEYFSKFTAAVGDRAMLGIIGHYCSAQIVNRMTVKTMAEEFLPIYNQTRRELMLQADDENLTPEEFAKRSGAKERTVFNYSVCKYGLVKLQNLIRGIYGNEFDKVFGEMLETVCSTVEEIQAQTVPEWLKVLNTFADMTLVEPLSPYFLIEGKDYAYTTVNGKNCIELYARACYFKYRAYCAASRSKPLFPSESAFTHALGNLSSLVSKGVSYKLDAPGGSVTLDLAELRSSGFMAP